MDTNEEGKAEKTFKNFGKKVDNFMEEFQEATQKLQKEFGQKFDELKDSAEKLKTEAQNKERWREVEDSLKKASDELGKAFKAAFSSKTEEQK